MRAVLGDLLAAVRGFLRRPFSSAVGILMLAVGLGFNTALFAVVDAVLFTPLPYADPDRVVMLWTGRNADGSGGVNSYGDFLTWQSRSRSFESLAVYNIAFGTLTGAGDPEELNGATVTPQFFRVLQPAMIAGRGLQEGDDKVALDDVRPIVIAHSLWTRRFGADRRAVGRVITFAGRPRIIVGVVGPEFKHPEPFWNARAEFWSPMFVTREMETNSGSRYLRSIGRLAPGVSVQAAHAEMDRIGRQLMIEEPATHPQSVIVSPIQDELVGDAKPLSLVFLSATALVLCLVIVNVVNLMLARMNHRREEFAIRVALGATRTRLMSQILAESAVFGLAGGIASLLFARIGVRLVLAFQPGNLPGIEAATINDRAVIFSIGLALITGLLCGVWPATRLTRSRLSALLGGSRATTGLEVSQRRTLIIATEVALAVPLLVGGVLLLRTLTSLQQIDPGFDPANAVQFRVNLPASYDTASKRAWFFGTLADSLRELPGVSAAGGASSVPLGGLNNTGGAIVFERANGTLAETGVGTRAVTSGYFEAMGIPLRKGRTLVGGRADAAAVVINERAAASLWPDANPIGRRIRSGTLQDAPDASAWLTVVGVVGDVRHEALGQSANAEIFQSHAGNPWGTMTMVARTTGDADISSAVRDTVKAIDAQVPVVGFAPVASFIDDTLARPRFGAFCGAVFGALGLLLTMAGTFAVLWLLVSQRTREIGIRVTFGASPRSVASMVVLESMKPAIVGTIVGVGLAALLSRALESLLYGVSARDPWMLAGSALIVLAASFAASWLPARRAMRMSPVATLRTD